MDRLVSSKSSSLKLNIRYMVNETLNKRANINRKIDGSNTLLHLAVEYDLLDSVLKLLSCGADANLTNAMNYTAVDIALNNGNQIMLQVIGRREDYDVHLKRSPHHLLNFKEDNTSKVSGYRQQISDRILPLCVGAVYEDYLDWSDSHRCQRLKELLESLKREGAEISGAMAAYCARRERTMANLRHMHQKLRDKEHQLCLRVWETVQRERRSRRILSHASEEVARLKVALKAGSRQLLWSGPALQRVDTPGLLVTWASWVPVGLELTGDALTLTLTTAADASVADPRAASPVPSGVSPSTFGSGPLRRQLQKRASQAAAGELPTTRSIPVNTIISVVQGSATPSELTITFRDLSPPAPADATQAKGLLECVHLAVTAGVLRNGCSPFPLHSAAQKLAQILRALGGDNEAVAAVVSSVPASRPARHSEAHRDASVRLLDHFCDEGEDAEATDLSCSGESSAATSPLRGGRTGPSERVSTVTAASSRTSESRTFTDSFELSCSNVASQTSDRGSLTAASSASASAGGYPRDSLSFPSGLTSVETLVSSTCSSRSREPAAITSASEIGLSENCAADKAPTRLLTPESEQAATTLRQSKELRRRSSDGCRDVAPILLARAMRAGGRGRVAVRRASTSTSSSSAGSSFYTFEGEYERCAGSRDGRRDALAVRSHLVAARAQRDSAQLKVEEVITARERLLERLHYLQALRAVVDSPPAAPTRTLLSVKMPSIEKAMSMLALYRAHVDGITDCGPWVTGSAPVGGALDGGALGEAEDFVQFMLLDADGGQAQSPEAAANAEPELTESGCTTDAQDEQSSSGSRSGSVSFSHSDLGKFLAGPPRREQQLAYGSNDRDLSVSVTFSQSSQAAALHNGAGTLSAASSSTSWRAHSVSANDAQLRSPFAEALCAAARSPVPLSPVRLQTGTRQDAFRSPAAASVDSAAHSADGHANQGTHSHGPPPPPEKTVLLGVAQDAVAGYQDIRGDAAASPSCRARYQILGPPPPEFQVDFDEVMRQLEEVWECELQSFEAARRLAQCLDLREQTHRRYARLKRQEAAAAQTLVAPQQEELYDVEL